MADGELIVAHEAPHVPATPMDMLSKALDRGADISVLDKLMDLQDRHDRTQARKAFDAAVADAKANIPVIRKNREGHNNKRYADFAAFAKAVDPVLAANGLSYRFRTRQEGAISVTCVLSHRDGHSEETTLTGGADTSGNKNSIQAIGSTLTYLQRYSLCAMLGLAASEDDDDGQASGAGEKISDEQLADIQTKLNNAGADIARFCNYMGVEALPDILAKDHAKALAAIAQRMKSASKAAKKGGAE